MSDINERRLLQRTNLALYLKVLDASNDQLLGNIIDINVCVFLLLTKQTLQENTPFNVKIELPGENSPQTYAECSAVVRRVTKSVNPSFNEIGFEITQITSNVRNTIEELEQHLLLKFSHN